MHVGGGLISVCGSIIHSHDMEDGKNERTGVVTRKSIINRLTITGTAVREYTYITAGKSRSRPVLSSSSLLFSHLLTQTNIPQVPTLQYQII